jgi:hypothetical protein
MTLEEAYRAGYQAGRLSMPEIVRCKDCKYNDDGECIIKAGWFPVKPDWFCADGEIDGKVVSTMLHHEQELIRCKDCAKASCLETEYGNKIYICDSATTAHYSDWFCADGEQK